MAELLLSIVLFSALHALPSTGLRPWIIAKYGRKVFMLALSVITTVLFVWMWFAYRHAAQNVDMVFWVSDTNPRLFSAGVMYVVILLVLWMVTNTPRVLISGEHLLRDENDVRGVLRITRHPMMWPLALWALVHMLNNADPAGFIYFGYFALLAIGGTFIIDKRRKRHMGARWARLEAASSNIPFAAILTGKTKLNLRELGWWRPVAAFIIWAGALHFHEALIGFPVF